MPHAKRSLGLIYAVNPFGADHQSSEHDPYYEEGVGDFNLDRLKQIGLGSPQPAYSLTEEKVRFAYETEVFYSMLDSAELCQFVYGPTWTLYDGEQTAHMIASVTGWDITLNELMEVGRRRLDLFRVFNAREGLNRNADKLPKKFFKALQGTGPTAGFALTHEEFESALDHYYKLAGYTANGIPTTETLKNHDVEWAAEYLPA
jgi:aldehyde:ferredoxin oxidoreductase